MFFLFLLVLSASVSHAWTTSQSKWICRHAAMTSKHHRYFMQQTDDQELLVDGEEFVSPFAIESEILHDDDGDSSLAANLPPSCDIPGNTGDFVITKTYKVPEVINNLELLFSPVEIQKKQLTPYNMSVPTALMVLDPERYPSQSKARKVCRKGAVLVLRASQYSQDVISFEKGTRARVGDRVYPGDMLAQQIPIGPGHYAQTQHEQLLPAIPVVYEDDHFAIVQKPAGYTIFRNYKTKCRAIVSVLPWSLRPPQAGTFSTLRRPVPVHRLDKPTSGLLLVAKTKTALVHLSAQFHDRVIQKTYMAIVNGIVPQPDGDMVNAHHITKVSAHKAYHDLQVDVNPNDDEQQWHLIDFPLYDNDSNKQSRSAVTVFRTKRQVPSLHARDGFLSLVELKPKTGRYHQLRRHMAWVCDRVLVGDSKYDGKKPEAMKFRGQGLFLSSTRVILEHPYYNTELGRLEWDQMKTKESHSMDPIETVGEFQIYEENGKIMVVAEIGLPQKFHRVLERANDRFDKFSDQTDELDDEE